ncbi:MAG: CehA/McbA family metallohydrolase [Pyrinomonadaceae bacterium]|nr:CehA/McbA family metallohydrolase [Pyrinomonadaceae bacterium]
MLTATRVITFAVICFVHGVTAPYVATVAPGSKNMQAPAVERSIHINRPGASDSRYAYIPFDVPPRTVRIGISYQYARANGANTIDIGLFDARSTGSEPDPRGFRGWSGGRRSEFFISRAAATPGYLPGAMPAGTWRIILGLYQVAPAGVDVSLKVQIETEGKMSPSPTSVPGKTEISTNNSATVLAAQNGPPITSPLHRKRTGQSVRWWSGDLHMHTVHSDGDWTIAELISSARNAGLAFISITDHNTASHHPEIDRSFRGARQPLVLRGEEITSYGGHANAWGLPSGTWIDFRARPGDAPRISNIAAQAHRAGALISINHPFALCGGCAWSYADAVRDFDAIEVWNGAWDQTDELALTMWDRVLQDGRRITAIASSDSHRPANPIGQPATRVGTKDLSQTSLLSAIRQGRVYLTSQPKRPVVTFEATSGKRRSRLGIGDEMRLSGAATIRLFINAETAPADATISLISNGQVVRKFLAKTDVQPQMIEIECQQDSYFRLEVRDGTKAVLALTNPIYVKIRAGR